MRLWLRSPLLTAGDASSKTVEVGQGQHASKLLEQMQAHDADTNAITDNASTSAFDMGRQRQCAWALSKHAGLGHGDKSHCASDEWPARSYRFAYGCRLGGVVSL